MGGEKKHLPLRLSEKLYRALVAGGEDNFPSVNPQKEYLLPEGVRQHRKPGGYVSKDIDKPLELDFLSGEEDNKS